jgi:hypothetical protein
MKEYARLELVKPVTTKGGVEAHELVVFRPTCRVMTEVLDTPRVGVQVERFVASCCRALNGSAEPLEFNSSELNAIDGSELSSVITEMSEEADRVTLEESGDGITSPLVYTLQTPIKLTPRDDAEVMRQIAFEGRRVGDISEFLDARGETKEFHSFMRAFGKPMGVSVQVMSDILIDALDFLDYLVIRRQIMGKLVVGRRKWKRVS